MKKICFITGTRADYGILAPVMQKIKNSGKAELQVIATNMHLSPRYGMTVKEIEKDGFHINKKIPALSEGDSPRDVVNAMAEIETGLADAFEDLKPDLTVILGDRYEALATASAAVVFGIPVAHLHGGETTEGAIDNMFRHAITQLSTYHFTSTAEYAQRVISMGTGQEKVFHSGAPGAEIKPETDDNNLRERFRDITEINDSEKFIILAIHPVTLQVDKGKRDIMSTLEALESFVSRGYKILATLPNSDPGNEFIRKRIIEWQAQHGNKVCAVPSLGAKLFHYALSRASAIVGNSSSALIEAPSFRLPAVNVGDRQKGRAQGPSVMNAATNVSDICEKLEKAVSEEFKTYLESLPLSVVNPYFKEGSAAFIAETILKLV